MTGSSVGTSAGNSIGSTGSASSGLLGREIHIGQSRLCLGKLQVAHHDTSAANLGRGRLDVQPFEPSLTPANQSHVAGLERLDLLGASRQRRRRLSCPGSCWRRVNGDSSRRSSIAAGE